MRRMATKVSLYLRGDGSLMLVQGDTVNEIHLTPEDLLTLGVDMLSIAVRLKPDCLEEATRAMEQTRILPAESSCDATLN